MPKKLDSHSAGGGHTHSSSVLTPLRSSRRFLHKRVKQLKRSLAWVNVAISNSHYLNREGWRQRIQRWLPVAQQFLKPLPVKLMSDNWLHCNVNADQSTHTLSVHESVSSSASKLAKRYQHMPLHSIIDADIQLRFYPLFSQADRGRLCTVALLEEKLCQCLTDYGRLESKNEPRRVALRCFKRLTTDRQHFYDKASGVSLRHLMYLAFLSVYDQAALEERVSVQDAREALILGMGEIQRGYNIEAATEKKDIPICLSGSFNKLINCLQGVHTDCNITYVTPALVSAKLPVVTKNAVKAYLLALDEKTRHQCLSELHKEGMSDEVWSHTAQQIADVLFDEFGSLYDGKEDITFLSLVECGQYVDLTDTLNEFEHKR